MAYVRFALLRGKLLQVLQHLERVIVLIVCSAEIALIQGLPLVTPVVNIPRRRYHMQTTIKTLKSSASGNSCYTNTNTESGTAVLLQPYAWPRGGVGGYLPFVPTLLVKSLLLQYILFSLLTLSHSLSPSAHRPYRIFTKAASVITQLRFVLTFGSSLITSETSLVYAKDSPHRLQRSGWPKTELSICELSLELSPW